MAWNINLGNLSPQELGVGAAAVSAGYTPSITPTGIDVSPGGGGLTIGGQPLGGLPSAAMQPIYPTVQQWDRQQTFYEENELRKRGLDDASIAAGIRQAEISAASNTQAAQIYASGGMAEAAEAARARVRSAEIAAQALRDVAQMDNATRLQIANLQAEVERERIGMERRIQESREFGQPINLASYIHYMTQGPGTAVPGTLPQQAAPGAAMPAGAAAATGAAPMASMASLYQTGMPGQQMGMPGQAQMGAPAAIVGEAGPELAQATPQGVQVTPIASQQVKPLQQMMGIPGMATGGRLTRPSYSPARTSYGTTAGGFQRMGPSAGATGQRLAAATDVRRAAAGQPTGPVTFSPQTGTFGRAVAPIEPEPIPTGQGIGGLPYGSAGAAGTTPVATTPAGTTTPAGATGPVPTTAAGDVDWQAFIDQLYGNVPAYSWAGGLELPGIGVNLPYAPFGQNVTDWQRTPWQVQQGKLSMWRALGIMPETAMGMMYAAAPTGVAQPVARRG